ncbi:MAG: UDP-N-acetylmuramate--L-alanine ligase [Mangrovibacterium sp.]
MRIHFIAIGGSAMHNLAIALHQKGYTVTGSDDEIFEPSKSRLACCGLLPEDEGWHPEKLSTRLDAVILGMHARADNPELLRARQIGLRIYSYPEYLYEQTKNKTRVVIGGSHGKTTITAMVMHVLKQNGIDFDYMVGAGLEGFETMVSLRENTRIAVFEGDEYLSSPVDTRPKFHLYHPHIALLSGIAWDHINVFPTFAGYLEQFRLFAEKIEENGTLIWYKDDEHLEQLAARLRPDIRSLPYREQPAIVEEGRTCLLNGNRRIPLQVFGDHNLQNIAGARLVCRQLDISDRPFYRAIGSFRGAARRLEVLAANTHGTVFYDFAHSPSKLKATTEAVKKQFPGRRLTAVMELHTFSSLKKEFLPQYAGTMEQADEAIVCYNPHTLEHKKLDPITPEEVSMAFGKKGLQVLTDPKKLTARLLQEDWKDHNLLIMSSGNLLGINLKELAARCCRMP